MTHYWVAVASKEHVLRGQAGGFAQVCHGKPGPLKLMEEDDWIVYYSPTLKFGEPTPCRQFTAIGCITQREPYQFQMSECFVPWRRDVIFVAAHEVEITPLIDDLTFIRDKKKWGFPFRRGCFSIPEVDFNLIATSMGVNVNARVRL